MNPKTQFMLVAFGVCFVAVLMMAGTILLMPRTPMLRWALLPELAIPFIAVYVFLRHYRNRFPPPTHDQRLKAVRSTRRLAWFFFVAPVVGFISRGRELAGLPYGLGFLLPLVPILIGVYYLRLSSRLNRNSAEPDATGHADR
jgi:hypothetical protein